MRTVNKLFVFLREEWILAIAAAGLLLSSILLTRLPDYSLSEFQVLFILFVLFITVKGLEHSGLITNFSRRIERGKDIPLKLIVATFFLSMLITNDVALIVIVPLTLLLNIERKDYLVILEAIAANAGSALTPIGNPQNLFIYWYYNVHSAQFFATILILPTIFLVLLIAASFLVRATNNTEIAKESSRTDNKAYIYAILLILVILTVLRVLPVSGGIIVIIYAAIFDRKSLRVDYILLISFFCFFGFAENMKGLLTKIPLYKNHIFLYSAISSQILSNVPVTILFAKLTSHWRALLWGSNVGGFGSPISSLANLIAFKFYLSNKNTNNSKKFIGKFLIIGYSAFIIGVLIYFVISKVL